MHEETRKITYPQSFVKFVKFVPFVVQQIGIREIGGSKSSVCSGSNISEIYGSQEQCM